MVAQPVEAVFVVYYGLAAHKAVYGRAVKDDTTYTKDYIQLVQDEQFRAELERLFPRTDPLDKATQIRYEWPGGSSAGSVEHRSADRPHLAWLKTVGAPLPWKMSTSPVATGPQTIPGDPSAEESTIATAQLDALRDKGMQPYLVAVKLKDEPNVLHVRSYIENPTPDVDFGDVKLLPVPVQEIVHSATNSRAWKWAVFDSRGTLMEPEVAAAVDQLKSNPSLLLIGPPGTGKTVLLEKLARYVESPGDGIFFDPDRNHDAWDVASDASTAGKTRAIVLHPSYSYDNLVVGLMPVPAEGGGVAVKVSTGPLVNLAHYASQTHNRALLILDEFNRGNAAAILGDALALLDKDKRGSAFIDLPYADLIVNVPDEFAPQGDTAVASRFTLPPNLWVVAAMNSSDRSVAPLDAALRRRFTIVELGPDYDLLAQKLTAESDADLSLPVEQWAVGHVGKLASQILESLNRRVDAVLGTDFRLGHSNFWNVEIRSVRDGLRSLASAFDHRIVQTLRLSLQDDDGALAAILRAGTAESPVTDDSIVAWWKKADSALGTFATDRVHIRQLSDMDEDHALTELLRQARF